MKFLFARRYLLARRAVQLGLLALFATGASVGGVVIARGNFSASKILGLIDLADPFAVLQVFLASFTLAASALIGALTVAGIYGLVLGRAFCGWVCPVNLIADLAAWLRRKFKINSTLITLPPRTRYWALALVLALCPLLSLPVFEAISYIGALHRGLIYGGGGWAGVAGLLLCLDLLSPRLICGRLCPLGGLYALISRFAILRISHHKDKCTHCGLCLRLCPEPQVLWMVGKKDEAVSSGECLRCGRCVEVCDDEALGLSILNLRRKK